MRRRVGYKYLTIECREQIDYVELLLRVIVIGAVLRAGIDVGVRNLYSVELVGMSKKIDIANIQHKCQQ